MTMRKEWLKRSTVKTEIVLRWTFWTDLLLYRTRLNAILKRDTQPYSSSHSARSGYTSINDSTYRAFSFLTRRCEYQIFLENFDILLYITHLVQHSMAVSRPSDTLYSIDR